MAQQRCPLFARRRRAWAATVIPGTIRSSYARPPSWCWMLSLCIEGQSEARARATVLPRSNLTIDSYDSEGMRQRRKRGLNLNEFPT